VVALVGAVVSVLAVMVRNTHRDGSPPDIAANKKKPGARERRVWKKTSMG
jgi:hypothetical protein